MRSLQRHSNIWMTTPVSEITIVLTCLSFSPQTRQLMLDWSSKVATFSAEYSSMAGPHPQVKGRKLIRHASGCIPHLESAPEGGACCCRIAVVVSCRLTSVPRIQD